MIIRKHDDEESTLVISLYREIPAAIWGSSAERDGLNTGRRWLLRGAPNKGYCEPVQGCDRNRLL